MTESSRENTDATQPAAENPDANADSAAPAADEQRKRELLEKYGYKRPSAGGGGSCGSTKRRTCC
jgi:hypothetical protein